MYKSYAIDIDDTLINLRVPMMQALNLYTNKSIHWKDWTGNNLETTYGISTEEFVDILVNGRVIERAIPIPGVVEALQAIKARGDKVHLITARGWHPTGYDTTYNYCIENNIVFDTINIVPLGGSKADVMDKYDNMACLIDDNESNCKEVIARGYKALLIKMPWHSKSDLTTINHVSDVLNYL